MGVYFPGIDICKLFFLTNGQGVKFCIQVIVISDKFWSMITVDIPEKLPSTLHWKTIISDALTLWCDIRLQLLSSGDKIMDGLPNLFVSM